MEFTGPRGTARRVDPDRLAVSLTADKAATLDYWWIHLPGPVMLVAHAGSEPTAIADVSALEAHRLAPGDGMDTFTLGLITLADLPGVRPANKQWPWVTHELLVQTLDTTGGPTPFETPLDRWRYMQPHNLAVQFEVADDDQARAVAADVAAAIVNGFLPPEVQAFVPERHKMMTLAPLLAVWQDVVDATAEHHRTGGTHEERMVR